MKQQTFLGVSQFLDMKPKPPECEKIYLSIHLKPSQFSLIAIGLDNIPNAIVFDEVTLGDLEEFKRTLNLYTNEYKTSALMYQDQLLESELQGCKVKSVQSHSNLEALTIVTGSLLKKNKIQIEPSLPLLRKLETFKGENPSSQLLALFCAVEELQKKLNGTQSNRKPLAPSISSLPYPQNPYRRY